MKIYFLIVGTTQTTGIGGSTGGIFGLMGTQTGIPGTGGTASTGLLGANKPGGLFSFGAQTTPQGGLVFINFHTL